MTETKKLTPCQELSLAVKLAAEGHLNQTDKGGKPYILHPLKVMHYLKTDDMQLMAIGVLHDHGEDCGGTSEQYRSLGFSERVIRGIDLLTKKDGISDDEYIAAIKMNVDAVKVKLADLRHNTDVRRLKGLSDKDLLRMRKYHNMHVELTKALKIHEGL
jgi:(p)ppGpp synthase/HD superfamily hydrolase